MGSFDYSNSSPASQATNISGQVELSEQVELRQPEEVADEDTPAFSISERPGLSIAKISALVISNILVWLAAYAYLRLSSPVYESSWGVLVVGSQDSQADVVLPDAGRATSSSNGSRTQSFEDARADYIYIAESSEVLKKAAEIARVDEADFGEPTITADDGSAIISFRQTAESPDLAHRKSLALYSALNDYLDELRKSSLYQKKSQNNSLLQEARTKVKLSQSQLAQYQSRSGFESDGQLDDLAKGIEDLRRLRSDYLVQADGLASRLTVLASNSSNDTLGTQDASGAYRLRGDQVYQGLLAEYGRLKTESSTVSADLSSEHPQLVQVREGLKNTEASLEQRSSELLGRSVSIDTLTRMGALITDPQVNVVYEDLFRESTINRADRERLISQSNKLDREIKQMESRLNKLSQDKLVVDRLKRELQVSEAVLASKVAKLDLNQDDIYSIFPPIKLVVEPKMPKEDKPIAPSIRMVLLTALAGSVFVTMGILLFWQDKGAVLPRDIVPSENYLQS